jgi:hypothetical protein
MNRQLPRVPVPESAVTSQSEPADNRLAEPAGWDEALLAIELKYLTEIDFTVELTGFASAEIDLAIGRQEQQAKPDPADEVAEPDRNRCPYRKPHPARID